MGWKMKKAYKSSCLCCSSTTLQGSASGAESVRGLPRSTGRGFHGAFTRDHPVLGGAYGR